MRPNGQINSPRDAEAERREYARAFNSTMVKIWKEKVMLLNAIDKGRLYNSVVGVHLSMDEKVTTVELRQQFMEYGIYAERGTGSNTPKGNSGDIGRPNTRKKKPWMTRKYLASMFNIREFFADSLGIQACTSVTNALQKSPDTVRNLF